MLFSGQEAKAEITAATAVEDVAVPFEEEETDEGVAPESDLDSVSLSNRAKNALIKYGVNTVEQLKALPSEEIQTIPGLGKKTISELMMLLGRE